MQTACAHFLGHENWSAHGHVKNSRHVEPDLNFTTQNYLEACQRSPKTSSHKGKRDDVVITVHMLSRCLLLSRVYEYFSKSRPEPRLASAFRYPLGPMLRVPSLVLCLPLCKRRKGYCSTAMRKRNPFPNRRVHKQLALHPSRASLTPRLRVSTCQRYFPT
jgi:hypothetical protein